MRLNDIERDTLRQVAKDCFEPDAVLRLFGSRLDDSRKGGDIDLLVETRMVDPVSIAKAHLRFLSCVHARLGEQKIDLLIDCPTMRQRAPIFEIARAEWEVL